jgi:hypothetical protein
MRRNLLMIVILLLSISGKTQSILDNGDFEDYGNGWNTIRTVDFYGTPLGNLGSMTAQSGSGFCGLRFYSTATASENWQEYIWQYILDSISAGAMYKVSLHYCIADMCTRTTDDFGVAFTTDPYYFSGAGANGSWLSSITPQIHLEEGHFPQNDSTWTELSGYYEAVGNEIYAIIGCFKTDSTLDTIGIQSDYHFTQGDVYFFIDNIRITECIDYPKIDMVEEIVMCDKGEITLDAYYPGASYLWSTGDTTSSITKNISQTEYLSVILTNNGCSYQDSTKITLFTDGEDFEDVSLCSLSDLPIERLVPLNSGEQLLWDNGSNLPKRKIKESGQYSYIKYQGSCSYADTFNVRVFESDVLIYPNPGVNEMNFTSYSDVSVVSIITSEGRVILNKPIEGDELDLWIEQLSPGFYFVEIERGECRSILTYEKLLLQTE